MPASVKRRVNICQTNGEFTGTGRVVALAGRAGYKGAMQRVRIGLTGLGFVFVAVLLAAALTGTPQSEAPITSEDLSGANAAAANQAAPEEPLAELGVAPRADVNQANGTVPAPR